MTAGLVLIGNELLSGKVHDTNGAFLIGELRRRGIDLEEIHVVADTVDAIAEAVTLVRERRDICITSGGIGPTHDDVTMEGIAAAFGMEIEERADLVQTIAAVFGTGSSGQAWRKMAWVPVETVMIPMDSGWPVYSVKNVFALPGIPEIFQRQITSLLEDLGGAPVQTNIAYFRIGEGDLARRLTELAEQWAGEVAIGSYPVLGEDRYKVKVTLDSRNARSLDSVTRTLIESFPDDALYELVERAGHDDF